MTFDVPLPYVLVGFGLMLIAVGWAYQVGRAHQQRFDWRVHYRRMEKLMADFTALELELAKLIAHAQAPKAEDPAIQAKINELAAQAKAVNDQLAGPPA